MKRRGEDGAALLSVLLLISVMTAISLAVLDDMRFAVRRQGNAQVLDQGYWYALGAENYAQVEVAKQWRALSGRLPFTPEREVEELLFPVPGGVVEARLRDASNCFNVNSLVRASEQGRFEENEEAAAQYISLLLALDMDEVLSEDLSDALIDWLDSDERPRPNGAEDGYYLSLDTPYRTANALMADISEIRAIRGYEQEIYLRLRPYLCARPMTDAAVLNVNSLTLQQAPLFAMLFPDDLTLSEARNLLIDRPSGGYSNLEALFGHQLFEGTAYENTPHPQVDIRSNAIHLAARIHLQDNDIYMSSDLLIDGAGKVTSHARRFGDAS